MSQLGRLQDLIRYYEDPSWEPLDEGSPFAFERIDSRTGILPVIPAGIPLVVQKTSLPVPSFRGTIPSRNMKTPDLTMYRRKLPHWRMSGAVYFVTWRLAKDQPNLGPEERTVVVEAIKHFERQRYELPGYVVMDDHVHVLVLPLEGFALHQILHSWKSLSAKRLVKGMGRATPVWQHEYFDRIVRDDEELMQKAQYILNNPAKRWPFLEEYPWAGLGSWV